MPARDLGECTGLALHLHLNRYLSPALVILAALAQATIMPRLALLGARPDLVLILVVSWTLLCGVWEGAIWAFVGGLALDLLSGGPFGAAMIGLMLVSGLSSVGGWNVWRANVFLPAITVAAASVLYNLVFVFLLQLTGWPIGWSPDVYRVVALAALLNIVALPFVYIPLRWLHQLTSPRGVAM